jgi:hypothetical protein
MKVDASPIRSLFQTGGLMEQCYAPLQRGGQSCCETADESASVAERGPVLSRAVNPRGHALQLEEDLSVVGRGCAGI